jgi:hypothetical protein
VFDIILPVIFLIVAVAFWIEWLPIASRAIRTGRLLGRGRIYDRERNPKMFWFGLIAMFAVNGVVTLAVLAMLIRPFVIAT